MSSYHYFNIWLSIIEYFLKVGLTDDWVRMLLFTNLSHLPEIKWSFFTEVESERESCYQHMCVFPHFCLFWNIISSMLFFNGCLAAIFVIKPILEFHIISFIFLLGLFAFICFLYLIIPKFLSTMTNWSFILANRPVGLIFLMASQNFFSISFFFFDLFRSYNSV